MRLCLLKLDILSIETSIVLENWFSVLQPNMLIPSKNVLLYLLIYFEWFARRQFKHYRPVSSLHVVVESRKFFHCKMFNYMWWYKVRRCECVCDKKKRSQIFNQREDYINYYRTQRKKKTGEDSISSIRFRILETSPKLIHLRFLLNIFPNTIQL